MKIYLSGSIRSGWQNKIYKHFDKKFFYDPSKKESNLILTKEQYTTWDLHFLSKSDIIFVYIEKDNPSCIGLSAEIGYAKALNKTIITVIEPNHPKDKYFDFLRACSNVCFDSLQAGIEYLKLFS